MVRQSPSVTIPCFSVVKVCTTTWLYWRACSTENFLLKQWLRYVHKHVVSHPGKGVSTQDLGMGRPIQCLYSWAGGSEPGETLAHVSRTQLCHVTCCALVRQTGTQERALIYSMTYRFGLCRLFCHGAPKSLGVSRVWRAMQASLKFKR